MEFPDDLRYSRDHGWVRVDAGRATVGVTRYLLDALGEVSSVGVPQVGTNVAAAEAVCEIEANKAASEIYSPLAGQVIEVNAVLAEDCTDLNRDPFGAGWLYCLSVAESDTNALLTADEYRALIDG